jgi:hypothetical protein
MDATSKAEEDREREGERREKERGGAQNSF